MNTCKKIVMLCAYMILASTAEARPSGKRKQVDRIAPEQFRGDKKRIRFSSEQDFNDEKIPAAYALDHEPIDIFDTIRQAERKIAHELKTLTTIFRPHYDDSINFLCEQIHENLLNFTKALDKSLGTEIRATTALCLFESLQAFQQHIQNHALVEVVEFLLSFGNQYPELAQAHYDFEHNNPHIILERFDLMIQQLKEFNAYLNSYEQFNHQATTHTIS